MFPLTHVFMAQMIFPLADNKVILGSIFPDTNIGYDLSYDHTHRQGADLYKYIQAHDKDFLPFVHGVITHGVEPAGLDYYGDEKYLSFERGYCFEKARPIIVKTLKACNLSSRFGWWKAHNFIEMGIELAISKKYPEVQERLREVYEDEELIAYTAKILSNFFYANPREIIGGILHFQKYVFDEPVNVHNLAASYNEQMIRRHSVKVDIKAVEALIEESEMIVKSDYLRFLSYVRRKILRTLNELIVGKEEYSYYAVSPK